MTPDERQRRAWQREMRRDAGRASLCLACVAAGIVMLAFWLIPAWGL